MGSSSISRRSCPGGLTPHATKSERTRRHRDRIAGLLPEKRQQKSDLHEPKAQKIIRRLGDPLHEPGCGANQSINFHCPYTPLSTHFLLSPSLTPPRRLVAAPTPASASGTVFSCARSTSPPCDFHSDGALVRCSPLPTPPPFSPSKYGYVSEAAHPLVAFVLFPVLPLTHFRPTSFPAYPLHTGTHRSSAPPVPRSHRTPSW